MRIGADGDVGRFERARINAIFDRHVRRLAVFGRDRDLAAIDARLRVVGRMDRSQNRRVTWFGISTVARGTINRGEIV